MSLPWEQPAAAAERVPVNIVGGWAGQEPRPGVIGTWRGTAAAEVALEATLLVEHFGAFGWSRSRRAKPDGLDLALSVFIPDRADWRPWVNLQAGGAWLTWQAPWPGGTGLDMLLGEAVETGRVVRWATTTGREDAAGFGLILLARPDVRFGRKRIWRLRAGIDPVSGTIERVLRGPRWGWDPPLG